MKQATLIAFAALICSTAFAQAPPGVLARPSSEANPVNSGGAPAAKAEMKKDEKMAAMPMGNSGMSMAGMDMSIKAMDANGDGKISKREYDRYHSMRWSKMKSKGGMVSMDEMSSSMGAMMNGGLN